ncbi:hypothetical protein PY365_19510 [Roseiarcaceae bacterium H3SJ34-1]|uniref:hypothetical protein n=1 Tax=Terripilifer ovatus TaxID=3032367 RepID=UPI003AB9BAA3|nr:hypothetical protein [Roseiarcaceae bacterium H3SJ34-1]
MPGIVRFRTASVRQAGDYPVHAPVAVREIQELLMRSIRMSEVNENSGFSYAMPRELAQQQLHMSLRLVAIMAVACLIGALTVLRSSGPAATDQMSANEVRQRAPVSVPIATTTFMAENLPSDSQPVKGSGAVHLR